MSDLDVLQNTKRKVGQAYQAALWTGNPEAISRADRDLSEIEAALRALNPAAAIPVRVAPIKRPRTKVGRLPKVAPCIRSVEEWADVLPADLAVRQHSWERRALVVRMRACGLTFVEIAHRLDISAPRAAQLARDHHRHPKAPIERFLAEPPVDLLRSPKRARRVLLLTMTRIPDDFAVLGYHPRLSFGDGGHAAYWDGWYPDRELAEEVARAARKKPEFAGLLFCVVSRSHTLHCDGLTDDGPAIGGMISRPA